MNKILALGIAGILAATVGHADSINVSDDLTLHYETAGSGDKTVLLVPGWMMASDVFERQLEHFEGSTEYRAIAYDPRGQGQSTKTEGGHYYDQRGADLNALITRLELDNITLVGWSFGVLDQFAYITQQGTDKLDGVVIVDGTVKTVGDDSAKDWIWYDRTDSQGYRQWYTMAPLTDRDGFNTTFAEWMLEDTSSENMDWVINIADHTSDSTAALLNETASYADYTEALNDLEGTIPLLYIVRDEWTEIVTAYAAENTPSARVVGFGKHMMFWEQHNRFNKELSDFLTITK